MRDLNRIIKKVIRETHEEKSQRYMFFSNLEQMRRQCDILLDMDHSQIEDVLDHGHDWADDHITVSKENLDQVFDFLMNYTKNNDMETSMIINDVDIMEGRKKTGTPLCARGKALAKAKYDVYPSAYSNGHAVQVCKGKIKGLDGKRHCSGAYC